MLFPLPPPLVLEHRVATVESVVAELARKTGQDLRARPEMADEALYVSLRPRDAGETMRLVARAASAEWFVDEGHTWLGRSPSFARRQARTDATATARAFAERLVPLLVSGDGTPWREGDHPVARAGAFVDVDRRATDEGQEEQLARIHAHEPAGRLLSRVLRALPPGEVAALPLGWSGRYALPATGRQSPLPGPGVRQYVEERRAFATEMDGASPETRFKVESHLMLHDFKVPTPDAPTVWLSVDRTPERVSFAMTVRDAARQELDQEYANVPALTLAEENAARALPGYADWRARKVPVGEALRAFARSNAFAPAPALAAPMRDPVAHEPLAVLTEPLDALAAATGGDAIVALPDRALRSAWHFEEGQADLGTFADDLAAMCALRMEGGTLVGPALRPTDAAFTKTRRAPLRDLFRLTVARWPRLLDAARYAAAQNPESAGTNFEDTVWRAAGFGSTTPPSLFEQGWRDPVRLFGGLSNAQRETLLAGGSAAAGDLAPAARADLERLVFARRLGLDETDASGNTTWREMAEAIAGIAPGMRLVGVPGAAYPFLASPHKDGTLRFTDAQMLGHFFKVQETGVDTGPWPVVARDRFRPATERNLGLALVAEPNLRGHADLVEMDLDPTAPAVGYRELPPAYREALAKGYGGALP